MTKAKENSGIWIKTGITLFVIISGAIVSFVWAQADIKAVDAKTDGLKTEIVQMVVDGCKPANKNKLDIALVQKDIATIQQNQKEMRVEQKAGFKEILRRLPK